MKRIKAACLCQTLVFSSVENTAYAVALKQARDDVAHYKRTLERNHTPYKIVEETERPDGSILVKVIRQYNTAPLGEYLN